MTEDDSIPRHDLIVVDALLRTAEHAKILAECIRNQPRAWTIEEHLKLRKAAVQFNLIAKANRNAHDLEYAEAPPDKRPSSCGSGYVPVAPDFRDLEKGLAQLNLHFASLRGAFRPAPPPPPQREAPGFSERAAKAAEKKRGPFQEFMRQFRIFMGL